MLKPWRALAFASFASLVAVVACGDAIHLDPDATTASSSSGSTTHSTTTTGSGGGDGGTVLGCASNADCPFPTPICDTVSGTCVGCLVFDDCAYEPGTVCSKGQCACPTMGQSYCKNVDDSNARCVDMQSSSADCGSCNHACFGACVAGKCSDAWEPTQVQAAPDPRSFHVAVWTGTVMLVWGGKNGGALATGGMYDPAAHAWTKMSAANAPSPRWSATAVWTGTQMIVWGGTNGGAALNDGGIFDPAKNSWTALTTIGAPSPRWNHSAVWTGTKMIVFGGQDTMNPALGDGAVFDPTNGWAALGGGGPAARTEHSALWGTSSMIVFGGFDVMGMPLGDGATYDPTSSTWSSIDTAGAPSARARQLAVWTGQQMLVFGGNDTMNVLGDGAKFNGNSWLPLNPGPEARQFAKGGWVGDATTGQMLIFGGDGPSGVPSSFWSYNSAGMSSDLSIGPAGRTHLTAVVAGKALIVWGGDDGGAGYRNDGGVYDTTFMP